MLTLKYATRRPLQQLRVLLKIVRAVVRAPQLASHLLAYLVQTYSLVDEPTLRKAFREVAPQLEEQMLSIAAQQWLKQGHDQGRDEGFKEGLKDGLKEGLEEGEREGLARTLLRQLERRFSLVSEQRRVQILSASAAELDGWLERVVDATNLDSVFR